MSVWDRRTDRKKLMFVFWCLRFKLNTKCNSRTQSLSLERIYLNSLTRWDGCSRSKSTISPNHSILTHGHPVRALTPYRQLAGYLLEHLEFRPEWRLCSTEGRDIPFWSALQKAEIHHSDLFYRRQRYTVLVCSTEGRDKQTRMVYLYLL